ncbi:MAG: hypothetical protein ACYCV0_14110 [Desulfitobacteriaceae bacterium]
MTVKNVDIRNAAKLANVRLWEVAERLGVSEATFTRLLRKELDANMKNKISAIIHDIQQSDLQQTVCL